MNKNIEFEIESEWIIEKAVVAIPTLLPVSNGFVADIGYIWICIIYLIARLIGVNDNGSLSIGWVDYTCD